MYNKKGRVSEMKLDFFLFIFCGFQHSIANAITYGVAQILPNIGMLGICAFGNLAGAMFISLLEGNYE